VFAEHSIVRLVRPVTVAAWDDGRELNLPAGTTCVVLYVQPKPADGRHEARYQVEFASEGGRTLAITYLNESVLEPD
jgi:hypothetical protein